MQNNNSPLLRNREASNHETPIKSNVKQTDLNNSSVKSDYEDYEQYLRESRIGK